MKVSISGIPPSLNKTAGRKNVHEYRDTKADWTNRVYLACEAAKAKPVKGKAVVTITYFFPTRGRRDPDNFCGKYLLDGLTTAGVTPDDSFKCIELRLRGDYDKANPRTEIEVTPCT